NLFTIVLLFFISITLTETSNAETKPDYSQLQHSQLQQLLAPFTEIQSIKLPFQEKRFSLFFKQAKEYRGFIKYTRPDLFVKQIFSPNNKKFVIEKNQLTIYSDNLKTQDLSLDDYPQFKQFRALFSGLLKGEASELTRYYNYDISKLSENKIRLTLKSLIVDQFTQENNTSSQQIDIIFEDQLIKKITMIGFGGERSEMSFDKALLIKYLPEDS
ncbi:MAG: hypothetical protein GQ546_08405, partial [Gammaproteobacteria bacterium]|nr:hypothetical protein [Gammaproteobacteria bacterium]